MVFTHTYISKVLILELCIKLLDYIVFSRKTERRQLQEKVLGDLHKLLQMVKKDVPAEDISKEKQRLWNYFGHFEIPKWLHASYIATLQQKPKGPRD